MTEVFDPAGSTPHQDGAERLAQRLADMALDTPALVFDMPAVRENISAMAAFSLTHGVGLRPHAKTHKCRMLAEMQVAAGAIGICCAKLGEAEALAGGAVGSVLVTSPIVGSAKIARLAALHARFSGLSIVHDSAEALIEIDKALTGAAQPLPVLVDLDVGIHRTGVVGAEAAVALARTIDGLPNLRFSGVQAYHGQIQHLAASAARQAGAQQVQQEIRTVVTALGQAGFPPAVVTGAGTGSFAFDGPAGVFTDLQVGSYVVMDTEYAEIEPARDMPVFRTAAYVAAQIISTSHQTFATVDAGSKSLSFDGPNPLVAWPTGLVYEPSGDEFGRVSRADGAPPRLPLGSLVLLQLPHCDPTINLHDEALAVTEAAVERWPITARGLAT